MRGNVLGHCRLFRIRAYTELDYDDQETSHQFYVDAADIEPVASNFTYPLPDSAPLLPDKKLYENLDQLNSALVPKSIKKRKPISFVACFDGCESDRHATIVLRGDSRDRLLIVKRVLKVFPIEKKSKFGKIFKHKYMFVEIKLNFFYLIFFLFFKKK